MLSKRIQKDNQNPQPYRALQIMLLYAQNPPQLLNLQHVIELAPLNGMTTDFFIIIDFFSKKLEPCIPAVSNDQPFQLTCFSTEMKAFRLI